MDLFTIHRNSKVSSRIFVLGEKLKGGKCYQKLLFQLCQGYCFNIIKTHIFLGGGGGGGGGGGEGREIEHFFGEVVWLGSFPCPPPR